MVFNEIHYAEYGVHYSVFINEQRTQWISKNLEVHCCPRVAVLRES